MNNPIPLEDMLNQVGKNRTQAANGLRVGFDRFCRAIQHHGIADKFPVGKQSMYVIPSLKLEIRHISPYYGGTIAEAAKALGVEYNKFMKGVKRKNLFHNFKGGATAAEPIYCPICRTNIVKSKYKMCEKCKGPGWYS